MYAYTWHTRESKHIELNQSINDIIIIIIDKIGGQKVKQHYGTESFCKELFKLEDSSFRMSTQQFTTEILLAGFEVSKMENKNKVRKQ